jgi:hypothetical protein
MNGCYIKEEDIVMNKKSIYFAHPMSHYDTDFEWECIDVIFTMLNPTGTEGLISVMNPNQKWLSDLYKARKKSGDQDPFEIFREIARACDIIVGVTFMDGQIGAGVAEECRVGQESGKEVYLIFMHEGRKLLMPFLGLANYKVLTIEETRDRIYKGEM